MNATCIISSIKSWFCDFRAPEVLISDNRSQCVSRKLKDYLSKFSIKHIQVPIYTPSSNGIFEHLNQTISYIMSIHKGENIKEVIQKAEIALNINYNRIIGT